MDSSLFDYPLPESCIAQEPSPKRDASKLMVVDRATQSVVHTKFAAIGEHLPPRSRLFRNNVSVLKARLFGKRATGGRVECLLLQPAEDPSVWWCLLRPGRKTQQSGTFTIEGGAMAKVLDAGENGTYRVAFETRDGESVQDLAERAGRMPLPPYIERSDDDPRAADDDVRYQTVYADPAKRVAVAAPTAGLHFTPELVNDLEGAGHRFHDLTLHVGIGTFQPIQSDAIEDHELHAEHYSIPAEAMTALHQPADGPRIAVGTTSVRSIEDAFSRQFPAKRSVAAEAGIYIYPPATFWAVDGMITNFHLPKSTLLCLVSAFLSPGNTDGISWFRELYAEAIAEGYRFYSYGDAMLIR